MERMEWTMKCPVGIDEIDAQHRLLFAIANELLHIENVTTQAQEFKYLYRHLNYYTTMHFNDELEFLQKIDYPDYDNHKYFHEKIIASIADTITMARNLEELRMNLSQLMHSWLKDHIMNEDKKYQVWYNQNYTDIDHRLELERSIQWNGIDLKKE